MKSLLATLSAATMIFAVPVYASQPVQPKLSITKDVAHGGGGRKDSPHGKCSLFGKNLVIWHSES